MSNPMSQPGQKPEDYLQAGNFIDSDNSHIVDFANRHRVSGEAPVDAAVRLYLAVRDEITYDPYRVGPDPRYFRASDCLATGRGFCIPRPHCWLPVPVSSAFPHGSDMRRAQPPLVQATR